MTKTTSVVGGRAYCSLQEAATYLGVSYKTVRKLVATGDLRAKKVGSVYRVRIADLDSELNVPTF